MWSQYTPESSISRFTFLVMLHSSTAQASKSFFYAGAEIVDARLPAWRFAFGGGVICSQFCVTRDCYLEILAGRCDEWEGACKGGIISDGRGIPGCVEVSFSETSRRGRGDFYWRYRMENITTYQLAKSPGGFRSYKRRREEVICFSNLASPPAPSLVTLMQSICLQLPSTVIVNLCFLAHYFRTLLTFKRKANARLERAEIFMWVD